MASSQYSSDPFAPNYRHISLLSKEDLVAELAILKLPVHPDIYELYESAEYAEITRPMDQLRVLLQRCGLEEAFFRITRGEVQTEDGTVLRTGEGTEKERHERVRKLLRDAGELELLEMAEKIWKLQQERDPVVRGEKPLEDLLQAGDEVGYKWIKMYLQLT
ncbi:hypothetical protein GQ44DRAFT_635715 [Phaeosphaeriaceae sp. PMI808]|nr:hypothetical protein GQ44DRAFT_635715 [Phaeosphaeriaceae sp. PMI808]